jgi:hypothetical protein
MYPEGKLDYPDDTTAALLPLERVYAVSVEEFERLIAAARDGAYLPNVLHACVEADAKPETAKFFFEQHLTAQRIPRGRSDLVNKALDRGMERVQAALSS